jgi:predicted transcriptional regulator
MRNDIDTSVVPQEMQDVPHWVVWRLENNKQGKSTKVPYQPKSPQHKASCNDPSTWADSRTAIKASSEGFNGIGFQAGREPSGFILIDLDHCIENGVLQPWARKIIDIANSYTEISPSGNGIHVFCGGKLSDKNIKNPDAEIYDHVRYFTVTGKVFEDHSKYRELTLEEKRNVYNLIKARKAIATPPIVSEQTNNAITLREPGSDDFGNNVLKKMFVSQHGTKIKALYNGDISAHGNDHSAADLALVSHLMHWCDGNVALIDSLFRQSGLIRPKWDEKHSAGGATYGQMTIAKAQSTTITTTQHESIAGKNLLTLAAAAPARFFETVPQEFQYIVPGLLAKGIVGFLYGEGGAYKSLAALWLVLQRACGSLNNGAKWLDRFEICGTSKSIFFSAEDVEDDLHHRVRAITTRIHNERVEIPESAIQAAINENCRIVSREQWISDGEQFLVDEDSRETGKIAKVVQIVQEFGADLVILETFSRITNVDEIDNKAGARVVGAMEHIRDATGASVLCIAHSSKVARSTQTDTHGQNGLRGAGALMDNSRFGLWFRTQPDKDNKPTIEIVNSKTFRVKRVAPFKVSIDFPAFVKIDTQPNVDVFDQIIEDVKNNPGTKQRETQKRVRSRASTISKAFKDAVDEGLIFLKSKKEGYYPV